MNFFSSIRASLSQPLFYAHIFAAKNSGIGFRYLLKLFALCWLVVSIVLTVIILNAKTQTEDNAMLLPSLLLHKLAAQFPTVVIEKGIVKFDGEQPYTITDNSTGKPLMVIDTTGTVRTLNNSESQMLLTRNQFKVRYGAEEVSYDIPTELNIVITSDTIAEWSKTADAILPYVPLLMLPLNVLSSILQFAGRWFLFAGIAYIVLRDKAPQVPDCLRLSAYVLTPSILLKMLLIASGFQPFGAPNIVIFGVGVLYLYFAVTAILRSKTN